MKKIKEYKEIIIIFLILILGAFYWYSYRPYTARKECNEETFLKNNHGSINSPYWLDMQEKLYKDCIRYKGLQK